MYHRFCLLLVFGFVHGSVLSQSGSKTCLGFDGKNDFVSIPDDKSLNFTSDISVEAWIKPGSFGKKASDNSIFCKLNWENGRDRGYALRCGGNGELSFVLGASGGGGWKEAVSGSVLKTNSWQHVVGSFDGDTIRLFVNGEQVAKKAFSGSIWTTSGKDARIGDLSYGGGRRFHGAIDEVRVWGKALAQDTIKAWMCRKITAKHPSHKKLAGYWNLDSGIGAIAADLSSHKNTGKLNNSPQWASSGAAIGDTSVFSYALPTSLSLKARQGDVFKVTGIKGAPEAIHLYLVNGKSTIQALSNATAIVDSTHQWGVFMIGGKTPSYSVNLNYGKNKPLSNGNECDLDLFGMKNYFDLSWSFIGSEVHASGDSIVVRDQPSREYIIGDYNSKLGISTGTYDSTFCEGDSLWLMGPGNDSFTFQWFKNGTKVVGAGQRILKVNRAGKYKVEVKKNAKCSLTTRELAVSVKQWPAVSISSISSICKDVDSLILNTGRPAGGVYSGKGVNSDSIYYPHLVSPGPDEVVYTFTDQFGCSNSDTVVIDVFAVPNVTISQNLNVCNNQDSLILSVGSPKGGQYIGTGFYGSTFSLDSVSRVVGSYNFAYEYTDTNGCSQSAKGKVDVLFATPILFQQIDSTCSNDQPIGIRVVPSLGKYSGKGVNGSVFYPSIAGPGSHVIKFEFKNTFGCVTNDSQRAVVLPQPQASFGLTDSLCNNKDSLELTDGLPLGGGYFGSGVVNGYFYPGIASLGHNSVFYVYTALNQCTDTAKGAIFLEDSALLKVKTISPICLNSNSIVLNNVSPFGGIYSGHGVFNQSFYADSSGSGLKQITYDFKNAAGCISKTQFFIEVYGAEEVMVNLQEEFCENEDSFLIEDVKPPGGVLSGQGVRSGYMHPNELSIGKYWVRYDLTDDQGCGFADSVEVTITGAPKAVLDPFSPLCANGPESILTGGFPDSLGIYYVNGSPSLWLKPSGLGVGSHTIKYTCEYSNGCKDSVFQTLKINAFPVKPTILREKNLLWSSSQEGNTWYNSKGPILEAKADSIEPLVDDGYYLKVTNDSGCTNVSDTFLFKRVGVASINSSSSLQFYPNPASTAIQVSSVRPIESIRLYRFDGQMILTESTLGQSEMSIDISEQIPGPYLLKVRLSTGQYIQRKLLISH